MNSVRLIVHKEFVGLNTIVSVLKKKIVVFLVVTVYWYTIIYVIPDDLVIF